MVLGPSLGSMSRVRRRSRWLQHEIIRVTLTPTFSSTLWTLAPRTLNRFIKNLTRSPKENYECFVSFNAIYFICWQYFSVAYLIDSIIELYSCYLPTKYTRLLDIYRLIEYIYYKILKIFPNICILISFAWTLYSYIFYVCNDYYLYNIMIIDDKKTFRKLN